MSKTFIPAIAFINVTEYFSDDFALPVYPDNILAELVEAKDIEGICKIFPYAKSIRVTHVAGENSWIVKR